MSEEEFSAEYFQHLLNALTLNSRALITELTEMAEKYIDNASTIVALTEDRIGRILPKYKLYSFYLMDSMVKNIGNPYNLMFARNLYKNFTETYLIVTDTMTRQNLINLFKTWITGKTSSGLDLFPHETLMKIEQFIIKATSLSSAPNDAVKITRDTLLREGNYLLQYVIALDEGLDSFAKNHEMNEQEEKAVSNCHQIRNGLIYEINTISETVMVEPKPEFHQNRERYASDLQRIRRALDDQSFKQQEILKGKFSEVPAESPALVQDVAVEINLTPKGADVQVLLGETTDDDFESFVSSWGKTIVDQEVSASVVAEPAPQVKSPEIEPAKTLANSLGLDIVSFNFQDSLLGSPKNEITHITPSNASNGDDDMDEDGYDPEESILLEEHEEKLVENVPSAVASAAFSGRSSLKRTAPGETRVAKRVRFDF